MFVALLLFPLVWGVWLSLNKVDLFGGTEFVGFRQYGRVLSDKVCLQSNELIN